MWPDDYTVILLALGLLPLAYSAKRTIRLGLAHVASLEFATVVAVWCGYHLSPWLAILQGGGHDWDHHILQRDYIDLALLFSTGATLAFIVGYRKCCSTPLRRALVANRCRSDLGSLFVRNHGTNVHRRCRRTL